MQLRGKTVRTSRVMGSALAVLAAILFASRFCLISIYADEGGLAMPDSFGTVQETLPEYVREQLPSGMSSEDAEHQGEALSEMLTLPYWLSVGEKALGQVFGKGVRLFALLCGLLVLSSVFHTICHSMGAEGLQNAARFCSVGCVFFVILQMQEDQLSSVVQFFERLLALMASMIPVTGTLLAMGGNVTTAAQGSATLGVFLSVAEGLCAQTVMPVCAIGTAMALCQALSPDLGLRGVASAIRKTYTVTLGVIMSLLCFLLSSQSTLCAAADGMGARTAKLFSGMVIPIVGSGVGETLRIVAGSVQYLKSIVGIGGIVFVLLLVLPVLLSLIVTRLVFLLGSGVAEMLGCEVEGKLISELGGIWGTMIAVVAMCSVMFILALAIFVRIAVAAG